jgi:hypothetical protein
MQLGSISGGISRGWLSFAGEEDQSALVEPESIFSEKTNVRSKLRVAVDVEVDVVSGEAGVLEVLLDVFEVNVFEVEGEQNNVFVEGERDLQPEVVWSANDVVMDTDASSVNQKSRPAVEEMPVGGMHTLTLTPVQVVTTRPEDNSNRTIDYLDRAGVYRHFMRTCQFTHLYPLWSSMVPPSPNHPLPMQSCHGTRVG